MADNIYLLPKRNDDGGYLQIIYEDLTYEIVRADSFGITQELPGFIGLWEDDTDIVKCFIKLENIKKINLLSSEDVRSEKQLKMKTTEENNNE